MSKQRKPKYIDLHLHPHGRVFNFLRNSHLKDTNDYHPWTNIKSNYKKMGDGKRAFSYAQSSLTQCWNGNCGVVFAALYPFEKGFFTGGGKWDYKFLSFLDRNLEKIPVLGGLIYSVLEKILGFALNSDSDRESLKDYFQSLLMRMPINRIQFFQSKNYDYWKELKEEYSFILSRNGINTQSKLFDRSLRREINDYEDFEKAIGTYVIARNYAELETALKSGQLVVILTIEGAHSFGTDTNISEIFDRIMELKDWDYPVFFITFAHHFNNFLCGHAHSLIKKATFLANQEDGLQAKFNEVGLAAARLLLSLTPENLKDELVLKRRILLDVKHMGVESRRDYYDEIVIPCMRDHGDIIPVIASHVCYSGIKTFAELIENKEDGKENDDLMEKRGLNHWNINICDEDIEIILKTKGLWGFCLDERIMGYNKIDDQSGFELLETNLRRMLESLATNPNLTKDEKSRIWEVLCIGTDFEGYIDPTQAYPTVLEFENLESDFEKVVQKFVDEEKSEEFFISKTASELARDFSMNNAMKFLRANF